MLPLTSSGWVPDVCTLPTAAQPLRSNEFDELFRDAMHSVQRLDARRARVELRPEPGVAARVADLMLREARCCSFFGFSLSVSGGDLTLDVTVPADQVDVLDALVGRARTAAGLESGNTPVSSPG